MQKIRENFLCFVFGLIIGVPFVITGIYFFADNVTSIVTVLLLGLLIVGLPTVLLTIYRVRIQHWLLGSAEIELSKMITPTREAIAAAVSLDIGAACEHAEVVIRQIVARYSWYTTIAWMIGLLMTLLVTFGALAGSALLVKQNDLIDQQNKLLNTQNTMVSKQNTLIETQNDRIVIQNQLAEASRRSTLGIEMTSIFDQIETQRREFKKFVAEGAAGHAGVEYGYEEICLTPELVGRLSALTRALRPYRYLDESNQLIDRPLPR